MPSTLVHVALGGLIGCALLGAAFSPRAIAVVLVAVMTLALWSLANAVLAGVSNGALASLLDDLHRSAVPGGPTPQQDPAPRGAALVLGGVAVAAGLAGFAAVSVLDDVAGRLANPRQVEIIAHRGAAAIRQRRRRDDETERSRGAGQRNVLERPAVHEPAGGEEGNRDDETMDGDDEAAEIELTDPNADADDDE